MISMRKTTLRKTTLGAMAAAGIAAAAVAAAPAASASSVRTGTVVHLASAAVVRPDAGWLGNCYPAVGSNWAGGWCDGNGPDWVYQGYVDCTNGYEYYGVVHWAGDRRGSYAYCPSGSYATNGGLDVWYQ